MGKVLFSQTSVCTPFSSHNTSIHRSHVLFREYSHPVQMGGGTLVRSGWSTPLLGQVRMGVPHPIRLGQDGSNPPPQWNCMEIPPSGLHGGTPKLGLDGSISPWELDRGTPVLGLDRGTTLSGLDGGNPSPPRETKQQSEYLLRGGQYASLRSRRRTFLFQINQCR